MGTGVVLSSTAGCVISSTSLLHRLKKYSEYFIKIFFCLFPQGASSRNDREHSVWHLWAENKLHNWCVWNESCWITEGECQGMDPDFTPSQIFIPTNQWNSKIPEMQGNKRVLRECPLHAVFPIPGTLLYLHWFPCQLQTQLFPLKSFWSFFTAKHNTCCHGPAPSPIF